MEQKWPSSLVVLRHGESARNVAKDIAKAAGKHFFDVGLRDLEPHSRNAATSRPARQAGIFLAGTSSTSSIPLHTTARCKRLKTSHRHFAILHPLSWKNAFVRLNLESLTDSLARASRLHFLKRLSAASEKANTGIAPQEARAARMSRSECRVSLEL